MITKEKSQHSIQKTTFTTVSVRDAIILFFLLGLFVLALIAQDSKKEAETEKNLEINAQFLDPQKAWEELQQGRPRTFERISAITMHPDAQIRCWVNDNISIKKHPYGIKWLNFESFKGGVLFFAHMHPPSKKEYDTIHGNFRFNEQNTGFIFSVYSMDLNKAVPSGQNNGIISFDCQRDRIYIDIWKDTGPAIQRQAVLKRYFSQHPFFKDWELVFTRR